MSTYEILLRLAAYDECEGFLSISKLAATVLLSSSRVSRLIDGLERQGLIERRAGERDARVSEVALSPQGREVCAAADITHRRVVNELFLARLSAQEAAVLAQVWRKVLGDVSVSLGRDVQATPLENSGADPRSPSC